MLADHLDRKSVLIYLRDQKAQEIVASNGWAGEIGTPSQDFLMVVDSSLPGHTTASVARSWQYRVDLVPGGVSQADLRIRYENSRLEASPDCRQAAEGGGGCYWNYVRVLLPPSASRVQPPQAALHEGSEKLIWGYRDIDSARTITHAGAGLTNLVEVGGFVVVEPSQVVTLPIEYELNSSIVRAVGGSRYEYRLELLKQPGVDRDTVDIDVQLPIGAHVVALSPEGFQPTERGASWSGALMRDTELVVVFELP